VVFLLDKNGSQTKIHVKSPMKRVVLSNEDRKNGPQGVGRGGSIKPSCLRNIEGGGKKDSHRKAETLGKRGSPMKSAVKAVEYKCRNGREGARNFKGEKIVG